MTEPKGTTQAPPRRHQLIHVIHHNKARYDSNWFGKGQAVLIVEKVHLPDGRSVKRVIKQDNPTIVYHLTAPEFQEQHKLPELAYPADKCDEYESSVDEIDRHVAELTGQMSYYNETRGPGANRRRRKLHDHRWLHGSDANLVDQYIDRYMETYAKQGLLDTTTPLELAFADIEVDPVDHVGFPDEFDAPVPVNLITYFHAPSKKLIQFIARYSVRENPLIAEFEENLEMNQLRILAEVNRAPLEKKRKDKEDNTLPPLLPKDTAWDVIVGKLGFAEVEDDDGNPIEPDPECQAMIRCTEVEFRFFDDEVSLIRAFLEQVNEVDRPDVISWWNMRFDANTLMNRLRKLGCDPEYEFTPKDFRPWVLADYNQDTFNTEPTDNGDVFTVTSYTIWNDQMLLYAQLRKTSGKKESYGLDFTLQSELKESKYEYEGSIRDLAYRDFMSFIIYGAIDVVPMAALEDKTEDIALAYQLSMTTRTRFHKIMKKTICLRNLAAIFYRERGLILSNNRNRNKERTDTAQFRGAFVADPKLMGHTGIYVGGQPSDRVFDDVVDFDATSLYPSIILATNIDASGQVGRLVIPLEDGTDADASLLVEAWACGDMVEVGKAWLGLPGVAELAELVIEQ